MWVKWQLKKKRKESNQINKNKTKRKLFFLIKPYYMQFILWLEATKRAEFEIKDSVVRNNRDNFIFFNREL